MPIDAYCERTGPDFWSEPVNALTNLAFLLAAVLAYRHVSRGSRPVHGSVVLLIVVLVAIGLGSFTFHTVATGWAAAFDTGPILIFMLGYVVLFAHWFLGLPWRTAWLGAPLFVVFAVLVNLLVRFGGSYLPALLGMFGLAGLCLTKGLRGHAVWFAGIGLLFAVSLTLRTLDEPLCGGFPLGTHFAWHLCNSAVLYLLVRVMVDRWREVTAGNPVAGIGYP